MPPAYFTGDPSVYYVNEKNPYLNFIANDLPYPEQYGVNQVYALGVSLTLITGGTPYNPTLDNFLDCVFPRSSK